MRKKTKKRKIGENVVLEQRDDVFIIYISNNLSYQTADELREVYGEIKDKMKVLIDLGQIRFTTSRGTGAVVRVILNVQEKDGQACLCNVSGHCMLIIEAMDLVKHVPNLIIFDTLDEGLEYFRNS